MQSIKELFDTATYGEIKEEALTYGPIEVNDDIDVDVDVMEYPKNKYGLRKRTSDDMSVYMDIDSLLSEEQTMKKQKILTPSSELIGFDGLSPLSKKIVLAESVSRRQGLIYAILADDKKIDAITRKLDTMDDDYSFILPSEVGNYMELWICANLRCPGCRVGKLFKYISSNMPVIDVRCVNPEHNLLQHGPIFFQIKSTEKHSHLFGRKYFTRVPIKDYPSGYIKVGSKRFGIYSHSITPVDSVDDKYISIGYICITYKYLTNRRFVSIDLHNSFVVLPNLAFHSRTRSNSYYYQYIPNLLNIPIISFNPDRHIVAVLTFAELAIRDGYLLGLFRNINLDKKYITTPYYKPTPATRELNLYEPTDYESKYLYYKNKYLKLKYNYNL